MFIWNINIEKNHNGNPYNNILKIIGKNNKIVINYENNLIHCIITKNKEIKGIKKRISIKTVEKDEISKLHNMEISIFNNDKNIYIDNISKSSKLSGKKFVKLAEIISKKIGGKYTYLIDGTSIYCNNTNNKYSNTDLSLYLLFKNNETYYQKLGYKLELKIKTYQLNRPNNDGNKSLNILLKQVKKLTLIKINNYNNKLLKQLKNKIINDKNINYIDLYNLFLNLNNLNEFLPNKINFIESLLKLYNENCKLYNYYIDNLKENIDKIYYNKIFEKEFLKNDDYIYLLNLFIIFRNNINWQGYFIKKL